MAKNELILTKENVNALCNKELKQDLVIMLEAIATGNQCVWDYAIAVHNIIETESFSDDFETVKDFCEWAGLDKSKVTQYTKAVKFVMDKQIDVKNIVVANAYQLSTLGDKYDDFVEWCEDNEIDFMSLSVRDLREVTKQYKESLVVADVDVEETEETEETDDMMNEPTSTDEETVQFTYRVSDNEFTVKEISLETYNKIMELLKYCGRVNNPSEHRR